MKSRTSICLAGLLLCASTLPQNAVASTSGPLVIFGDSLSDSGNASRLTDGAYPDPQYYKDGRLSNGAIWTDLAAPRVGYYADLLTNKTTSVPLDGWNFAVAGARSGSEELDPATLSAPGLRTQVREYKRFLAAGAIRPDQRAASAAIWSGANDYGLYVTDPVRLASGDKAFAGSVVANITAATKELTASGAREVLILNLFDFTAAPTAAALPADLKKAGDDLVHSHNDLLLRSAEDLNLSNGARVLVVDVNSLIRDISANPALYGFNNVSQPCLPDNAAPQCATSADADKRLFWDGTHLTRAGHALVYEIVRATQLAADHAPALAAAIGDSAMQLASRHHGAVINHFANSASASPLSAISISTWAADARVERDAIAGRSAYALDSRSYGGGIDINVSTGLRVGIVGSYLEADAAAADAVGSFTGSSSAASLIASWTSGPVRAEVQGGRAWQNFDAVRKTGLSVAPDASAKTDATVTFMNAKVMWAVKLGAVLFEPRVELGYADLDLNGWQENGGRFMNIEADAQHRQSLVGKVGANSAFDMPVGAFVLRPFASVDYSREMLDGSWQVGTTLGSGQHIVTTADTGDRDWVELRAGVALQLTGALSLTTAYETRVLDKGDALRSYAVGLNFRF